LIGIRVALPDGRLAGAGGRVVKNVSGYDLMKLHYGAMGTLGVIVAASFKVFPKPLRDVTVAARGGWDDIARLLRLPLPPSALELFEDGRIYARFFGTPGAVDQTVAELGWPEPEHALWPLHAEDIHMTRIATPPDRLRDVLSGLTGWWASPGTGIAYWSPPGLDIAALAAVRAQAEAAGGSLVVIVNPPGALKDFDAWGTPPTTIDVMQRIKDAFDPNRTMNPGRFVV
jgi:glycolate oxidase FAD binding subunit